MAYNSTLLAQTATPEEIQKADLDLLKKINETQSLVESGLAGIPSSIIGKGTITNSYTEIDTTSRTFTTVWAAGMTWTDQKYEGNSKLLVLLYIPARNNSTSWGGGYVELQYRINGGAWVSIGSSGYDQVMANGVAMIGSNTYHFLLDNLPTEPCTVGFKTLHKAYDGTLLINDSHELTAQFASRLTTIEISKFDQKLYENKVNTNLNQQIADLTTQITNLQNQINLLMQV